MDFGQQYGAVALVLALLGAALWWLRRRGPAPRKGGRRLETLERLTLSGQHTLHLVRVDGRVVLVGCSPGACVMLASVEAGEPGRAPGSEQ